MCGADVHGETSRGTGHVRGREGDRGRTEWGRELMLFLLQSLSCPKPAEVFANRTGRGQMKRFGTAAASSSTPPFIGAQ